jgi:hypothetical protein
VLQPRGAAGETYGLGLACHVLHHENRHSRRYRIRLANAAHRRRERRRHCHENGPRLHKHAARYGVSDDLAKATRSSRAASIACAAAENAQLAQQKYFLGRRKHGQSSSSAAASGESPSEDAAATSLLEPDPPIHVPQSELQSGLMGQHKSASQP